MRRALALALAALGCGGRSSYDGHSTADAATLDAPPVTADSTVETSEPLRDGNAEPAAAQDPGDVAVEAPGEAASDVVFDGCKPMTCAERGFECGLADDGCGHSLNCDRDPNHPCPTPQWCGGNGPNGCGCPIVDVPRTCEDGLSDCGITSDGLGGILDCGTCPAPYVCSALRCVWPRNVPCVPATCQMMGAECGKVGDGCGGMLDCGTCHGPQYCGGGGLRRCGGACVDVELGADCGLETVCRADAGPVDATE